MVAKKNKKGVIEDTADFVVAQPIKHNGEDYQVGEIITLTEKDGVPLLELGVIKVDDDDWDDSKLNPEAEAEIDAKSEAGAKAEIEVEAQSEIDAKEVQSEAEAA